MIKFLLTFKMALRDARANLMHTLLSVLGIVIGVAALVSILSLIDGLEKYAHEQISMTTHLENVMITTRTSDRIDGVSIKKDSYHYLNYEDFVSMAHSLDRYDKAYMYYTESGWINKQDTTSRKAIRLSGILENQYDGIELLAGQYISSNNLANKDSVMLVNELLAKHLVKDAPLDNALGKTITYHNSTYEVIGVLDSGDKQLKGFIPITLIPENKLHQSPAFCVIRANDVGEVPHIKEETEQWISERFGAEQKDIIVATNESRVKQANQGFMVFRIVMGMIVGISVLVGGIGVMNVLLISVTERTAEIGVRKAVGAKRKDIISQFLSESIAISGIGSIMGVIIGIGFTAIAVPIVKSVTEMPFEAAYTLNTLMVITIISVLVGVIFGTYPAMKAAKLDPVEAIRRE